MIDKQTRDKILTDVRKAPIIYHNDYGECVPIEDIIQILNSLTGNAVLDTVEDCGGTLVFYKDGSCACPICDYYRPAKKESVENEPSLWEIINGAVQSAEEFIVVSFTQAEWNILRNRLAPPQEEYKGD